METLWAIITLVAILNLNKYSDLSKKLIVVIYLISSLTLLALK